MKMKLADGASTPIDPIAMRASPTVMSHLTAPWRLASRSLLIALHLCVALVLASVILLGAGLSSAKAQGISFIRDSEIENLLNEYSNPIFQAAGLGKQRIRVRIVRDKAFNAFVLDGRNVFMNTGALMIAGTPNQVIGVIAHETGHIAGGHLAGLRAKIKGDVTRNLLMKALGVAAMVFGGSQGSEGAVDAGKGIFAGSDELTMRSILTYRQAQESSADQAGLAYLNSTRQSARGMLETFETFAQQELFSDQHKDPYVRSHPIAQHRINQLRQLAEATPYFNTTDPPALQLRHDLMRAKLSGFLEPPQTVFNRYPNSDQTLPAQYARTIAAFFGSGLNAALPQLDALIAKRPDYAYFWELKGDFYVRAGRPADAIAPLQRALKLDPTADLMRIQLAQAMIATQEKRHLEPAIAMLRKALVNEDSAVGFRQLANAYWAKDQQAEAYLATARAYLLEGQINEAKSFAKRAQAQLKSGSPGWLRADDIINLRTPRG